VLKAASSSQAAGKAKAQPAVAAEHPQQSPSLPAQQPAAQGAQATLSRLADNNAEFKSCMMSANGYTSAMASCLNHELAKQGERLNVTYEAALAASPVEEKTRLQEAQSAWVKQRDSQCRDFAKDDPADMFREGSCRLEMTSQRLASLQQSTH
jgi:uncharacterized protein YecT (DUF1311 family)